MFFIFVSPGRELWHWRQGWGGSKSPQPQTYPQKTKNKSSITFLIYFICSYILYILCILYIHIFIYFIYFVYVVYFVYFVNLSILFNRFVPSIQLNRAPMNEVSKRSFLRSTSRELAPRMEGVLANAVFCGVTELESGIPDPEPRN